MIKIQIMKTKNEQHITFKSLLEQIKNHLKNIDNAFNLNNYSWILGYQQISDNNNTDSPLLFSPSFLSYKHPYNDKFEYIYVNKCSTLKLLEFPSIEIDNLTVRKVTSFPLAPYKNCNKSIYTYASSDCKKVIHYSSESENFNTNSDECSISPIKPLIKHKKSFRLNIMKNGLTVNYQESIINKRFRIQKIIHGYNVLLSASGEFYPNQLEFPLEITLFEQDYFSKPLHCHGFVNLAKKTQYTSKKGYRIPFIGNIQLIVKNPNSHIIKIFTISYNLHDIPNKMSSFIRQKTYMNIKHEKGEKLLLFMIHLRFLSGSLGNLYLYKDIRIILPHNSLSNLHEQTIGNTDIQIDYFIPDPKYFRPLEYS